MHTVPAVKACKSKTADLADGLAIQGPNRKLWHPTSSAYPARMPPTMNSVPCQHPNPFKTSQQCLPCQDAANNESLLQADEQPTHPSRACLCESHGHRDSGAPLVAVQLQHIAGRARSLASSRKPCQPGSLPAAQKHPCPPAMYAGAACMANPMPAPYSSRPAMTVGRPGASATIRDAVPALQVRWCMGAALASVQQHGTPGRAQQGGQACT